MIIILFSRELMESLGDADTLDAQSKAILIENDIRDEEFTDEVKKSLFLKQIPKTNIIHSRSLNVYR